MSEENQPDAGSYDAAAEAGWSAAIENRVDAIEQHLGIGKHADAGDEGAAETTTEGTS